MSFFNIQNNGCPVQIRILVVLVLLCSSILLGRELAELLAVQFSFKDTFYRLHSLVMIQSFVSCSLCLIL